MPGASISRRNILHRGPTAAGPSFDGATTAWVNAVVAAGGAVSATQKTRVDTLIKALKAHSLFTKLDRLWLWAGENDAHQAAIDIVNLGVGTVNGSLTLAANGYTGDGSTGYFDSGFNPNSAGGHYTAAAALAGAYIIDNRASGGSKYAYGADSTSSMYLNPYNFGNLLASMNDQVFFTANAGTNGLWIATQLSGTATIYNWSTTLGNAGSFASAANASPGIPPANLFFLALNSGGAVSFDPGTEAAAIIGGSFSSGDAANLAADLNAYMTSWGVNQF